MGSEFAGSPSWGLTDFGAAPVLSPLLEELLPVLDFPQSQESLLELSSVLSLSSQPDDDVLEDEDDVEDDEEEEDDEVVEEDDEVDDDELLSSVGNDRRSSRVLASSRREPRQRFASEGVPTGQPAAALGSRRGQ